MPTSEPTNQDPGAHETEVVHGAGSKDNEIPEHAKHNVAPMPEIEKGAAIPGLGGSGGGSSGVSSGPDAGQGAPGGSKEFTT